MKNKFCLLLSLILIVIVAITSYTPQAAQAEVQTQEDPVSEAGEGPSRPDAEIRSTRVGRVSLTPLGLILSLMIPL